MEPPSDIHGAIYGTDDPLENPAASMYRGPYVPSTFNPTPMAALPYPQSIVDNNPRPSPTQPYLDSEIYSTPGQRSAIPQSPSVINYSPRSHLAMPYLPSEVHSNPSSRPDVPQSPSIINYSPRSHLAMPYLPLEAHSNPSSRPDVLQSPSIIDYNPIAYPAMPYLPSEAHSNPRPRSDMPQSHSIINCNPTSYPAIPYPPSQGSSKPRPPPAISWLPSPANIQPKPPPGVRVQDRTPVYHHHQIPRTSALSTFRPPTGSVPMRDDVGPPVGNIIALPRRDGPATGNIVGLPRSDDVGSPIVSTVKDPSICDQRLAPREKKQIETKKNKASTTNQTSSIRKKPKTPKARTKKIEHSLHDLEDVRNKEPKDWDEIRKIQQVLQPVFRSFGAVTAQPPPQTSLIRSYHHQRAVLQQASDHYWRMDRRPGQPPQLASLGAWHGPISSITNAPVEITEEDLEPAIHPSLRGKVVCVAREEPQI